MAAKPNFFIVGAPKCGTTALYEYLRAHPNVFLSKVKEPHFFASDLGSYPCVRTLDQYYGLFADRRAEHLGVGEASVYYLHSSTAIANISGFNPDAKIIAMLRNPVDMAHSMHSQLLYLEEETVSDFESAWRLQERRSRGIEVPANCREASLFQYRELCRLGTQIQRLLSVFPPAQVKVILLDDLIASPRRVYDEVIEFLGLPHDNRCDFPRVNENKRARFAWLSRLARKPPPVVRRAFRGLKRAVGAKGLVALKTEVVNLNTLKGRREPLSPSFRAELVEAFRDEVALLSQLLNRDLNHWSAVSCQVS